MKRYKHYWWPLRGCRYPSMIAVLDCDEGPGLLPPDRASSRGRASSWQLRCQELRDGIPVGRRGYSGQDIDHLWRVLATLVSSRRTTWLFFPVYGYVQEKIGLQDALEQGTVVMVGKDWSADRGRGSAGEDRASGLCVIEDPPTLLLCQLRDKPGKLLVLDLRNYGVEPLGQEVPLERRTTYYLDGLCDCVSALRADRPTSLRGTAASQAVQSLRTHWDVRRLHCHVVPGAAALERSGLFGGRNECFYVGKASTEVFYLDVRSMYPALCLTLPVPVSLRRYHDRRTAQCISGKTDTGTILADVTIRTGKPDFPCRLQGKILYPTGEFRTTLCSGELHRANIGGNILRWHAAAEYNCAPVLRGFYEHWLSVQSAARSQGRAFLVQFVKRLMVSLIGKFSEPGRRWVPCPSKPERDAYQTWYGPGPDGEYVRFRNFARRTQREERYGESYWSVPAITAWVYATGRSHLWDILRECPKRSVLYCDTDGIICDRRAFDSLLMEGLIRDNEVGHLRVHGRYNGCAIYGLRHYSLDETIKCSGVPRGRIYPGESRYDYWQRIKAAQEITVNRKPGSGEGYDHRPVPEPYRHGTVGPDGWVTPLEV